MSERERTTKYVTGTFNITFHGSYVDVDEIERLLHQWLDGALEDRDDLYDRRFNVTEIEERGGDPEGYDQ